MKKWVCLLLACTMSLALVACGSNTNTSKNKEAAEATSSETGKSEQTEALPDAEEDPQTEEAVNETAPTTEESTIAVLDNTAADEQQIYDYELIYVGTSEECSTYQELFDTLQSDGYIASYTLNDETSYQPHGIKTGFKAFVLNGIGDIYVYGASAHNCSISGENIEPGDGYIDTLRENGILAFEMTDLTIDEVKELIKQFAEE